MRNILIIDDEKDMRKKYKKILKSAGFKVFVAPDAVEVANVLMREKSSLDLILLDINMAEVDGRDTFEIIEEYTDDTIPVMVTSVYPLSEQKIRIPKATDYFDKSDRDDLFLEKVKKIVGVE